jgi:hypothetical protein
MRANLKTLELLHEAKSLIWFLTEPRFKDEMPSQEWIEELHDRIGAHLRECCSGSDPGYALASRVISEEMRDQWSMLPGPTTVKEMLGLSDEEEAEVERRIQCDACERRKGWARQILEKWGKPTLDTPRNPVIND